MSMSSLIYQFSSEPTGTHALLLAQVKPRTYVLDVGCASGYLGDYLIRNKQCHMWGIESHMGRYVEAMEKNYDVLINKTIEDALLDPQLLEKRFNHILAGDVFEHVVDPKKVLEKLGGLLEKDGTCIVSLPNVAHYSIRWSLALGKWDMQDSGIMDRTHLHFYTEKTAKELFAASGYECIAQYSRGDIDRWFGRIGLGGVGAWILRTYSRLFAVQYVFVLSRRH